MDIPANFPYKHAFLAGRPVHDRDGFSLKHPKMARGHRAKIFAPFAALDGFGWAIKTKDITYIPPVELSEDEKHELDNRLHILSELTSSCTKRYDKRPEVTVEYYVPCDDPYHDAYGNAGIYQTVTGVCWRVDVVYRMIMVGDTLIHFDDIRKLDSAVLEEDEP